MAWRSALRQIRRRHPDLWNEGERLFTEYSIRKDPADLWFAHAELEHRGFPTAADYIDLDEGGLDPEFLNFLMSPPSRSHPAIDVTKRGDVELRCYYVVLGAFRDDTLRWMLKGAPELEGRFGNNGDALESIIPIFACVDTFLARRSFSHRLLRPRD